MAVRRATISMHFKDNRTATEQYLMGFYNSIYNDLSSAHQHYDFLQKLRLGTWYSIEDVYQIIWACAVSFACFWWVGWHHDFSSCIRKQEIREINLNLRAETLDPHPNVKMWKFCGCTIQVRWNCHKTDVFIFNSNNLIYPISIRNGTNINNINK